MFATQTCTFVPIFRLYCAVFWTFFFSKNNSWGSWSSWRKWTWRNFDSRLRLWHLEVICICICNVLREGRGHARTQTWRPLPDLLKMMLLVSASIVWPTGSYGYCTMIWVRLFMTIGSDTHNHYILWKICCRFWLWKLKILKVYLLWDIRWFVMCYIYVISR